MSTTSNKSYRMPVQHFPVNFTTHQSPISPVYSPYELSSSYSALTDSSSASDSHFQSPVSPDDHYAHNLQAFDSHGVLSSAYELEYSFWATETKTKPTYHVPRSQTYVNQYHVKTAPTPYVEPPVPPHQRVASQVPILSPVPTHPCQNNNNGAAGWPYSQPMDFANPHSPRIKIEEYSSSITSFSSHELLAQHQHASRTSAAMPYEAAAIQAQDPNQAYNLLSSFNNQASISTSHQSPDYYSPTGYHHQSSPSQDISGSQTQSLGPTTVHPAQVSISPVSASPLSAYPDHHHDPRESSWPIERKASMSSLGSDIPIGDMGLTGGDMGLINVGMSNIDASGDDDAEGEEDWDHPAAVVYGQHHYQEGEVGHETTSRIEDTKRESVSDPGMGPLSEDEFADTSSEDDEEDNGDDDEFVLNPRQKRTKSGHHYRQGRGTIISARAATAASTTSSSYRFADRGFHSYPTSEGRTLRSRSSARYAPYQSHSDTGYTSASEYSAQGASQDGDAYERRRYNSTSASSSASPYLSSSHDSTITTSRKKVKQSHLGPTPVPVPNLTKKSRGRRVPTMSCLEDLKSAESGAGKKRQAPGGRSARMYLCDVEGCGKCFARGEHLKRHVRSIHTYEKRKSHRFASAVL